MEFSFANFLEATPPPAMPGAAPPPGGMPPPGSGGGMPPMGMGGGLGGPPGMPPGGMPGDPGQGQPPTPVKTIESDDVWKILKETIKNFDKDLSIKNKRKEEKKKAPWEPQKKNQKKPLLQ